MILIDSDVVVDIWRGVPAAVAWLRSLGSQEIVIPGYVAMEVLRGCRDLTEHRIADAVLGSFRIAWPDSVTCAAAYQTYRSAHLSNAAGILDVLIGHTALAAGLPLHTFNEKHFKVIPNLLTVRPYIR